MPCGTSARFESNTRTAKLSAARGLEQGFHTDTAGEVLLRAFEGSLRTISFDIHDISFPLEQQDRVN
jgi:hypothetical protein